MAPIHTHACIIWFDTLQSTNTELKSKRAELDNLSIVAAKCQTAGRGQGDHVWNSSPGENLTFSLLLKFPVGQLRARDEQIINSFVTPVLVDFLASEGVEAWVKAPNDIWVKDKKIAGILIENVLDGYYVADSVVGIGFNLNQTQWQEDLPNPISLKQLTGKDYSVKAVLEDLRERFVKQFEKVFGVIDL